jgi:hypothetical protein
MSTRVRPAGPEWADDLVALGDCCGYRVDDPNGRVGTVDAVVGGAWSDRPEAIEVRVGLFRPSLIIVGVEDVAGVDPVRRRVVLRTSVDLGGADHP